MTDSSEPRKLRFQVGDKVRAVGPGARRRSETMGYVTRIESSSQNLVNRYRVTFNDGSSDVFFGFELEAIEPAA
jgi:hypothetical protein